jgi:uncharacterized membrane protein YeaQ/YmgE (transglycosylase-associated protein family)
VGLIAGALAKYVIPGEGPGGVLGDIVIGLIGALIGGWLLGGVLHLEFGGIIGSIIEAFIGAVILLFVIRMVTRRSA